MKHRLLTSVVAAVVYMATYVGILLSQNEPVVYGEILLGGALFFVAFFLMRRWLDQRRERRDNTSNEQDNQKDLPS